MCCKGKHVSNGFLNGFSIVFFLLNWGPGLRVSPAFFVPVRREGSKNATKVQDTLNTASRLANALHNECRYRRGATMTHSPTLPAISRGCIRRPPAQLQLAAAAAAGLKRAFLATGHLVMARLINHREPEPPF